MNTNRLACSAAFIFALASSGCHRSAPSHGAGDSNADPHGEHAHADQVTLNEDAIQHNGVRVEQARTVVLTPTFVAPGRVSFNTEATAHVGSPISGRVVELRARAGQIVAKGEVLLVIESPELGEAQSDFLQKRTAAQTAGPTAELARKAYERAKDIYESQQGITLTEVQKRESEHHAAQATLAAAQTSMIAAENRLHLLGMSHGAVQELLRTSEIQPHSNIVAPIAGTVIDREVTLGELVNPDKEALLVLADMTTLWVLADVPESQLSDVELGAKARIIAPAIRNTTFEGTVSFISPSIDPGTRSASVRIEVGNGHTSLSPGMFVQVEIEVAPKSPAALQPVLAIPEQAVQTVEGGPAVFVVVQDNPTMFEKRPVLIGPAIGGMVPVLSGLKQGEFYVAAGSFILKAELGKGSAEHEH